MEKYELLRKEKQELKALGLRIRALKFSRKLENRNGRSLLDIEQDLFKDRYDFRHRHIAYCLTRGRAYKQIENPKEDNPLNEAYVAKLLKEYEDAETHTLCPN